jgi:hypothetical protein
MVMSGRNLLKRIEAPRSPNFSLKSMRLAPCESPGTDVKEPESPPSRQRREKRGIPLGFISPLEIYFATSYSLLTRPLG